MLNQSQGGIHICGAMKIGSAATGEALPPVPGGWSGAADDSSICVFHLGISLAPSSSRLKSLIPISQPRPSPPPQLAHASAKSAELRNTTQDSQKSPFKRTSRPGRSRLLISQSSHLWGPRKFLPRFHRLRDLDTRPRSLREFLPRSHLLAGMRTRPRPLRWLLLPVR